MHALVHRPGSPSGLAFADVAEPVALDGQVLVEVAAISLNAGETRYLAQLSNEGAVPGWDAAGTVVAAAPDGTGPPVGTPVVTFGWGSVGERRRAVDVPELAVLPPGLDPGAAATLPVAGVTALRAVRRLALQPGQRVLVTGASGGLGRFAVQFARREGAHVIAAVGRPGRDHGLHAIGATSVVVGITELAALDTPVDAIIDNVGGPVLVAAWEHLRHGGLALAVGSSGEEPLVLDLEAQRRRAGGTGLELFVKGADSAADLAFMVKLLARGELSPEIGLRLPWSEIDTAVGSLLARRVEGKVVLDVDDEPRVDP